MGWFKIAAIAVGILIAFLVVGSVMHFILTAVTYLVIAAIVAGGVAIAIKVARSGREVSGKKAEREVRDREYEQYSRPLPASDIVPAAPPSYPARPSNPANPAKPAAADVEDELARLKREMGS